MARGLAHLSDKALVALVARADEDALAELYDASSASPGAGAADRPRPGAGVEQPMQDPLFASEQSV